MTTTHSTGYQDCAVRVHSAGHSKKKDPFMEQSIRYEYLVQRQAIV